MTDAAVNTILRENEKRRKVLFAPYDPTTGIGSPIPRRTIIFEVGGHTVTWGIPQTMYQENKDLIDAIESHHSIEKLLEATGQNANPATVNRFLSDFTEQRFRHDFEFWAVTCARITDKKTKQIIPFKLNWPQRYRVLVKLEQMRLAEVPIRIIIDKARQWGGSTLVQIYMSWFQIIHKTGWHSAIVTEVEDQARNIRAMYSRLVRKYPQAFGTFDLAPFEGSTKNRQLVERGNNIIIGSSQQPNSIRTFDLAMCHLSEVAFWRSTEQRSAEDLAQSVRAAVSNVPYSMIVIESTAKGVGNFFHREWLSAMEGKSSYAPIFVPWFEIELYQQDIQDYAKFIKWMQSDTYASYLWSLGATLEGIKWYFETKRGENYDDWRMHEEYPSTWQESFQASGARVFSPAYVERLRKGNCKPIFTGEIAGRSQRGKDALEDIVLNENDRGNFQIWEMPDKSVNIADRYVVSMDIGGRTKDADYSVIRVFDRYWMSDGGTPTAIATWRSHIDQDLLAWKGVQICKIYNNAMFIPESNSFDRNSIESEGDHFLTIIDEVVKFYPNIYARTDQEKIRQGLPLRYGFHTNAQTKPMVIDFLNGIMRDDLYVETDARACDEMDTYETKPNGRYGAVEGCHDDIVMTTAIGVWGCYKCLPLPQEIKPRTNRTGNRKITEATI